MNDVLVMLGHWQLDVKQVRERVYRAPTPRERERWHALWLLACGRSVEQVDPVPAGWKTRSDQPTTNEKPEGTAHL